MASKNRLEAHVVLTTKYRRPVLTGLEEAIYDSFLKAEFGQQWEILAMGVEDGNHVHLAVRYHPTVALSDIVSRVKQRSTFDLWESHCSFLRKTYWREKRLLWAKGYFADSIGAVPRDKILAYVTKQNESAS